MSETPLIQNLNDSLSRPTWSPLFILALTFLVITCWNLNIQSIANPDEPRYAAPARIMLRSDKAADWMVPNFNTRPRILKPILFYWLIAATGGIAEKAGLDLATGMRLGPVLMGLLTVLGIFLIGRKLFNQRIGFIAAIMLMTARFFHEWSRELVVDMTLTACLIWSWVFFVYALERIRNNQNAFLMLPGFYVSLGLACMTKGPALVAIFSVAPLLAYIAWNRQWSLLKKASLWWGVPLTILIGFWWFVALKKMGYDILKVVETENLSRAVGGKDHQKYAPFLFYIQNMFDTFAPWCVLVPFACWWTFSRWRQSKSDASGTGSERILSCALIAPWLILGVIISKRPLYMLPAYPFMALWIAWYIDGAFLQREGEPSAIGKFSLGALAIVMLAAAAVGVAKPQIWDLTIREVVMLALLGGGMSLGLFFAARNAACGLRQSAVIQMLAVAAALVITFETVGRPIRERRDDSFRFFRQVCEQLNGRPIVMYGESSNEAVWYLDRPNEAIDDVRSTELKARFFDAPGTVLLMPEKEINSSAKLKDAVTLSKPIVRGKDNWYLAVPREGVVPDPAIFEPKGKRAALESSED